MLKQSIVSTFAFLFAVSAQAASTTEWTCTKQLQTIHGDPSGKLTVLAIRDQAGRKTSYRYKLFYTSRLGAGASAVLSATVHPESASDIYYGEDGTQLIVSSWEVHNGDYVAGSPVAGMVQIKDAGILELMSAQSFQKDVSVDQISVSGLSCKR